MKTNTLYLLIATLIAAAGAYWYFFTGTGNDTPITASAPTENAGSQFEALANQLPAAFNTAVLSDERFLALTDNTTPISDEALGRPDPLAPIPGVITQP